MSLERRSLLKAGVLAATGASILGSSGAVARGVRDVSAPDPGDYQQILEEMDGDGSEGNPYVVTDVVELQAIDDADEPNVQLGNDIDASPTAEWNETDRRRAYLGRNFGNEPGETYELAYSPVAEITGARDGEDNSSVEVSIQDADAGVVELQESTNGNVIVEYRTQEAIPAGFNPVSGPSTLDGSNNVIEGLTIERREISLNGLFTRTEDVVLRDFGLRDASVTGTDRVGLLAAESLGGTTISGVSVEGIAVGETSVGGVVGELSEGATVEDAVVRSTVEGRFLTGGVAGDSGGTITETTATVDVTVSEDSPPSETVRTGGIAGETWGTISRVDVRGTVSGNFTTGGVAGTVAEGTITDATVAATVEGAKGVGGIAGGNSGTVEKATARGEVVANENTAGGIVGNNLGTVRSTLSEADVSGSEAVGGIAGISGYEVTEILSSIAVGSVDNETGADVGAVVGRLRPERETDVCTVENVYADGETTGQDDAVGRIVEGDGTTDIETVEVLDTGSMTGETVTETMGTLDFDGVWQPITAPDGYPVLRSELATYATDDGVVDTRGLRAAVGRWRDDALPTRVLLALLDAWRDGQPVR